jgi:hypothetical protein
MNFNAIHIDLSNGLLRLNKTHYFTLTTTISSSVCDDGYRHIIALACMNDDFRQGIIPISSQLRLGQDIDNVPNHFVRCLIELASANTSVTSTSVTCDVLRALLPIERLQFFTWDTLLGFSHTRFSRKELSIAIKQIAARKELPKVHHSEVSVIPVFEEVAEICILEQPQHVATLSYQYPLEVLADDETFQPEVLECSTEPTQIYVVDTSVENVVNEPALTCFDDTQSLPSSQPADTTECESSQEEFTVTAIDNTTEVLDNQHYVEVNALFTRILNPFKSCLTSIADTLNTVFRYVFDRGKDPKSITG